MKNSQRIQPKIPDGMVELMKNLAKSVLKEQPDNIYLFAAEYFENLVRERDGSLDKGYSTFRKYDDEIAKRRGVDVCPRCNCILHPERKDDDKPAEGDGGAEEDNSPRNDGENALDMSVNGVAIKAMPRDSKSTKSQKNRQRLETIRSVSMDSAIEDDGKSQSPKSNSQEKPNDSQLNLHGLSALSAVSPNILNKINEDKPNEPTENTEKQSSETIEEDAVSESPVNETIADSNLSSKLPTDDDVPDTPTNDTSVSETITDRTVIEVAPLNSESKNDELNTLDSTQVDDLDMKSNDTDTITTVFTEPIEEQKPIDTDVIKIAEPTNLQLEQVKQIDRLRTPESDSGLSEKSFNLNIQENEETVTNEVNEIKDNTFESPVKLLNLNEKEFDATSKDDSGIVDIDECGITTQLNTENKQSNETLKGDSKPTDVNDEKAEMNTIEANDATVTEQQPTIDAGKNISEKEMNDNVAKGKEEVPKLEESDDLKKQNDPTPPSTNESQISKNENPQIESAKQNIESLSEEKKPLDSVEPDSKLNSTETTDNNHDKSKPEAVETTITPEQGSNISSEPINDQKQSDSTQSTHENEAQTPEKAVKSAENATKSAANDIKPVENDIKPAENAAQDEQRPLSPDKAILHTKDDSKASEEIQTTNPNENVSNTSESIKLKENKEQPYKPKSADENQKTEIESNTQINENKVDEKPQDLTKQVSKADEKQNDEKTVSAEEEKDDAKVTAEEKATADPNKKAEEKPSDASNNENKIDETKNDQKPSEPITTMDRDVPKSADQTEKINDKLNETPKTETLSQEENKGTSKDELNSDGNSGEQSNSLEQIEAESSTEKLLEEKNNKRNKREIDSFEEDSTQAETIDEKPNDATSNDLTVSQEEKPQSDAMSLNQNDLKSEGEKSSANQNNAINSPENVSEVEEHDGIPTKDTTSEKDNDGVQNTSENVEKIDKTSNETEEKSSNKIEPDVVRMDSKALENVPSASSSQNELPSEDDSKNIESNEITNTATDEPDHTSWQDASDKIAEKVAEQDANVRKVSVSSLIGDKDEVTDKNLTQAEEKSTESHANDNEATNSQEEKPSENVATEQNVADDVQESIDSKPNETVIKPDTPAESEMDKQITKDAKDDKVLGETKSIDQNFRDDIPDESRKEESVEDKNDKPTSAKAKDLRENNSTSHENDTKIDVESNQSEDRTENEQTDTKSMEQNDTEKISNETKTNESQNNQSQSNESVGNEIEKPPSPARNENDRKSATSVQLEPENQIDIEKSAIKLDLNMPDEASDDVYGTPPETSNGQIAISNDPNDKVDSKLETDDKSKEDKPNSAELPQNSTIESSKSQDDSHQGDEITKHDKNNESVIEMGKPSSQTPEESNLVDEVKENKTILPAENTANHSKGVNESMEKSTMPTEQPSVDEPDSKHKENRSVENVNSEADKIEKINENERPVSAKSESIDTKASNGIEQGNEYDAKSMNNDDVASELSVSVKDEYEQAETEVVGDESVKDLDLSSNHELEPNQANESVESEQQITALEIPPPTNDNDSIDSPKQTQIQPDSLDILVDSLDASLEPSVDADSLNIDSLEDKPRSAKSTDTGKLKDSPDNIIEEVSRSPINAEDEINDKITKNDDAQPSTQNKPDSTTKNDKTILTLMAVPKVKRSTENEPPDTSSPETVMGDVVDCNGNSDIMHDQMRNELEVLRLAENLAPIQMLDIAEVDSPLTPKQEQTNIFVSKPDDIKETTNDNETTNVNETTEDSKQLKDNMNPDSQLIEPKSEGDIQAENEKADHKNAETDALIDEKKVKEEKFQEELVERNEFNANQKINAEFKEQNTSFSESVNDTNTNTANEDQTEQSSEFYSTTIETSETQTSEDVIEVVEVVEIVEEIKCVKYLKPTSHDTPSSDLSDTDTTDKAEKVYTESGVDETSRDERDEVSEIENFDLSSCGEDSLEAMYYLIRKNEIIMDRHKQTSAKNCEDEKIIFPEKATDDLEHAVREVSGGKKVKLCSMSMNSSIDDVVLKKMSSDSDEIQIHVIPNSEIDSSSSGGSDDPKSCPLKEQCTANESTDDEYINPIVDSMRKNENAVNEMHAKALTVQPNQSDTQSEEQPIETDTFNEMDDMMPGNIERKILASSVSEADSDYFELPPTANRLTKDDFNVSTAFEHMIQTDNSTTDDSESTIESAATKIQASARGFITRRRIRKSSAGTSASNEKRSSIGNAAIDKSLDNFVEENAYSESFEESSPPSREMDNNQTIDSVDSEKTLGITEVKVEQRKNESTSLAGNAASENSDEKVPEINIQGISEESATAQRRLMLQRGDAMQRNSTPESSEQQQQQQQQQQVEKEKSCKEANNEENNQDAKNKNDDDPKIDISLANASQCISKPFRGLGPRQRSMPVQIDSQVIRVLPKQVSKRVKSASSSSSKNHRPHLF